ncbi:MAG: Gfo/Idh/MocA family oxidoreductase [Chthoniobacterales bacterium]|nr:Gfo/Idh/MocA family oxidoreductase [Chthoniobacterales bacterium]
MSPVLNTRPELPAKKFPIAIIGTGGIVKDAHLPAYRLAGFPVWGMMNRTVSRAEALAKEYGVSEVFDSLDKMVAKAPDDVIYDLALPASMFVEALRTLPDGSHVLIQKPMGENLEEAREILRVCREKGLRAAINCQLRYAPFVLAARSLIAQGVIGDLLDMEMRLNVFTPWGLFPFLEGIPRVEIVYHSVHYIDLFRSFLGEPRSMMARTVPHPSLPKLASVSSSIIMDYPDPVRATITTNHSHRFGAKHQESYLKWEGTKGAIVARIGLLMDYPRGVGDTFEYCALVEGREPEWTPVKIEGSWFPEAFIGTMAQVMRAKEGSAPEMPTSVEDVIKTMACVEAAYESSRVGGVPPGRFLA